MTGHTPGPWVVSESEKKCLAIFPGNEHGRPRALCSIAWVQSWNDTADDAANARLIAAAPDLLDAITNLMNGVDTGLVRVETPADETLANAFAKIRAAIAKARGKS